MVARYTVSFLRLVLTLLVVQKKGLSSYARGSHFLHFTSSLNFKLVPAPDLQLDSRRAFSFIFVFDYNGRGIRIRTR